MERELWKPYEMYGKGFLVSSHGRIKSVYWTSKTGQPIMLKGTVLKTSINDRGYEYVSIKIPLTNKKKRLTVHRIVCALFHPNPENKPQVNHKDLNQLNNHSANLEWATAKENTHHAHSNGARE